MLHMKDKKLEVSAIENGTVIDHIPAKALFKVISILNLDKIDKQITFGTNLDSKKLEKRPLSNYPKPFLSTRRSIRSLLWLPRPNSTSSGIILWLKRRWLKFRKKLLVLPNV